jgi:hypothetical protein
MSECTLSSIAIAIAVVSLGLSIYVAVRDRGTVSASARYLPSFQNLSDGIFIHVVNSGRRPVTVRRLLLEAEGKSYEHKLEIEKQRVRLMESEDYEFQVNPENSELLKWAESKVVKAVVEDSRGRKYKVEDLAKIINENSTNIQKAI